MGQHWRITLTLEGSYGEKYDVCLPVDDVFIHESMGLMPPAPRPFDNRKTEEIIRVIQRKEFRKDLLRDTCRRLGTILGQRLEDKEGWHGEDRQEGLKDWGKR